MSERYYTHQNINSIKIFKLSARAYNRVIKISRTIADLSEDDIIDKTHLTEALSFRGDHMKNIEAVSV